MSTDTPEPMDMATKPIKEHEWLQKLVGEWRVESEMVMPEGTKLKTQGTARTKSLGGLWAFTESTDTMPDGTKMESYFALGYDVSFKEYRGCMVMSASSHLWKYTGELSADGKTMTFNCEGPSMITDGETALYRDVIELIDENHRTLTSNGQDEKGEWQEFMKAHYYRV
ncbi:MAG TPA: DUF1579 domain-containing protein [Patescibacteria group bacterium]